MADPNVDTIRDLKREREGHEAAGHKETVKAIDHLLKLLEPKKK